MMNLDFPVLQWSSVEFAVIGFTLGAAVATTVAFLRWRLHKKVVRREFWTRMVDGYVALERSHRQLESSESDSLTANLAMSDRLELSAQENQALHQRLHALEAHIENVTTEATSLVSGLKDNEQRWAEAETIHSNLHNALEQTRAQLSISAEQNGSLTSANEDLTHHLLTTAAELTSSKRQIEQLQSDLARRSNLEERLNEALDRDRQQMATLARLEGRYKKTHREFLDADLRATQFEQQLQAGSPVAAAGVFDRPVPATEPITLSAYDHAIDLRSPPAPAPRVARRRRGPKRARLARSHGRLPD